MSRVQNVTNHNLRLTRARSKRNSKQPLISRLWSLTKRKKGERMTNYHLMWFHNRHDDAHLLSWFVFSLGKVWFKNKRAKCRQIQKQNTTSKPAESQVPANLTKKPANVVPTTKLKAKASATLLNNSSTTSLLTETSNFIKAQNPFLIPAGSSKVIAQ